MKQLNQITSILIGLCLITQAVPYYSFAATSPKATAVASVSPSQRVAKDLDALLATALKNSQFSGTVLLTQNGKTLLSKSYGYANEEYKVPASSQTVYRYASLTKQITGAAVLKLAEQGKVKLSDPIGLYIKDFPNGNEITIKMLLNHTSGLRDDMSTTGKTPEELLKTYHSPKALVALISKETLGSKPGEVYFYSNHGYILLGHIIEVVTGKSYESYIQEQILAPLNITGIQMDNNKKIIANRAEGYALVSGKKQKADYIDMSNAYAAGGLVGTASSYLKWQQSYYNTKLLSKSSWDQLFNNEVKTLRSPWLDERYGLGVMMTTLTGFSQEPMLVSYHTGGVNGFRNFQMQFKAKGIDLVLLSNNESLDLETLLTEILILMMGLLG